MKTLSGNLALIASAAGLLPATAAAAPQLTLKLERVVMLMRHGIRPPTALQPIPLQYSAKAWPQWPVAPGLLTPHGAQGIALLAASDRAYFARSGLLASSGCPAIGQVAITASHVPRAIATAEAWANGLAPRCKLAVAHPAPGAPDPLFHILDSQPAWFDGQRAYRAALAQPPKGGIPAEVRQLTPELRQMSSILGCSAPACNLLTGSSIKQHQHGRPDVEGPLDAASTAGETFLLEYLEGMPENQVAWGLAGRDQISRLLVFNSVKFKYVDRPQFIAAASAGPLAKAIVQALFEWTARYPSRRPRHQHRRPWRSARRPLARGRLSGRRHPAGKRARVRATVRSSWPPVRAALLPRPDDEAAPQSRAARGPQRTLSAICSHSGLQQHGRTLRPVISRSSSGWSQRGCAEADGAI